MDELSAVGVVSNWVLSETFVHMLAFTTLDARDFLQQGPIHFCLLGVHHASKSVLPLVLNVRAAFLSCTCCARADDLLHGQLVFQEFLVLQHLPFALLLLHGTLLVINLGTFDPAVHVGLVRAGLILFTQVLLSDLSRKLLV